jgi:hypothetical protein
MILYCNMSLYYILMKCSLKCFFSSIPSCGCARSSRRWPSKIGTDSSSQALKDHHCIVSQPPSALTSPSRSPFPFIYRTRASSPFHQLRVYSPICALRPLRRCIANPHELGYGPPARIFSHLLETLSRAFAWR